MLLSDEEGLAGAAAARYTSDSESQADDNDEPVTNLADIADDDDIDENLFDGDDLDIVEQELDSLVVVDWRCHDNVLRNVVMTTSFVSSQYSDDHHRLCWCYCRQAVIYRVNMS